jgi:hypothetical protein
MTLSASIFTKTLLPNFAKTGTDIPNHFLTISASISSEKQLTNSAKPGTAIPAHFPMFQHRFPRNQSSIPGKSTNFLEIGFDFLYLNNQHELDHGVPKHQKSTICKVHTGIMKKYILLPIIRTDKLLGFAQGWPARCD